MLSHCLCVPCPLLPAGSSSRPLSAPPGHILQSPTLRLRPSSSAWRTQLGVKAATLFNTRDSRATTTAAATSLCTAMRHLTPATSPPPWRPSCSCECLRGRSASLRCGPEAPLTPLQQLPALSAPPACTEEFANLLIVGLSKGHLHSSSFRG